MNEDSWVVIVAKDENNWWIRTPHNYFKANPNSKHFLSGIHSLYVTVIVENYDALPQWTQDAITVHTTTAESKIIDLSKPNDNVV